MSISVSSIRSPMLLPLLRIERWVRQAAFGIEVVPLVNCILTTSSGWRPGLGTSVPFTPGSSTSLKAMVELKASRFTRPEELSATMICFSEGTSSDCSMCDLNPCRIFLRSGTFDCGSLLERFVSAPMIRWDTLRWLRAEITC